MTQTSGATTRPFPTSWTQCAAMASDLAERTVDRAARWLRARRVERTQRELDEAMNRLAEAGCLRGCDLLHVDEIPDGVVAYVAEFRPAPGPGNDVTYVIDRYGTLYRLPQELVDDTDTFFWRYPTRRMRSAFAVRANTHDGAHRPAATVTAIR
jgi:hypothetical protein